LDRWQEIPRAQSSSPTKEAVAEGRRQASGESHADGIIVGPSNQVLRIPPPRSVLRLNIAGHFRR
jgi:hypothetical protein